MEIMKVKKAAYIVFGSLCLVLGVVGTVLPILPSVPFFMLTVCCFARSSERLYGWFVKTKFYKNNLESFCRERGMTRKAKIKIMVGVTILMTVGFVVMKQLLAARIILAVVWGFHVLYFLFGIKTIQAKDCFE